MPSSFPRRLAAAALVLASTAGSARAQVGYTPEQSPFHDLVYRQELTLFTGLFHASEDPAKVAPRSGPMFGAKYAVRVGGPAWFTARLGMVSSDRRIINPLHPVATRFVGTKSSNLWLADVGLDLALTGQKSFHNFVPVIGAGAGIASNFDSKADSGGYKFGTNFAFTFGTGLRWVPGGRWQARVDLADYLYQITYPDQYYLTASDSTSVLTAKQATRVWKHNVALTIGASYQFFR